MDLLYQSIKNEDLNFIHFLLVEDPMLVYHVFEDGSTFEEVYESVFKEKY